MSKEAIIQSEQIKDWGLESTNQGELLTGACNTLELARIYGTPLHVVNKKRLRTTAESFLRSLGSKYPGKISVHYAFKCNPVPGVIEIIKNAGFRAEVMSEFELHLALKLGYTGKDIIVNGPLKTVQLITACLENNIRFINIDSLSELERIENICSHLKKDTEVLLRINPDIVPSKINNGSYAASRKGSPFGLDLKSGEVKKALEKIKVMNRVKFRGFHFHLGSGIQNTDDYKKAIIALKKILSDTENSGFNVDVLDIGGGLGVTNSREMNTLELLLYQAFDLLDDNASSKSKISFDRFANSVTEGVLSLFRNRKIPELIFEPGRCITGPNQLLLLRVHQVKERKGLKKWLVTDAGIGTLTMPTYYEHHKVLLCNDINRKATEKVTITGPGCFTADVVYRNKLMPDVTEGEILAILDSGAYFTSWESSFGFPRPAIISVNNGCHTLLRARESFNHMMSLDKFNEISILNSECHEI
jgi:diaminopimelate decarboxylase